MKVSWRKTAEELNSIREAASISTEILQQLVKATTFGKTPLEIDKLADSLCSTHGVKPAFRGAKSGKHVFTNALCISVNDAVLHGVPDARKFVDGDVVKLDFGIVHNGFHTDHCVTIGLGNVSTADRTLIQIGKLAVESAVAKAKSGMHTGDLGYQMQTTAEMAGFRVLEDYVGHGIGRALWEPPQVAAYGTPGTGEELQEGMVICIEAQIVAGSNDTYVANDNWTVKTVDGQKGVMFEYMVLVSEQPEILTPTTSWEIFRK